MLKDEESGLFIWRIVQGKIPFNTSWGDYYLGVPSVQTRYKAEEIYKETLQLGELYGLYSTNELQDILLGKYNIYAYKYGLSIWTPEQESKLNTLKEDIEKLKIGIFESQLYTNKKEATRKLLRTAEKEYIKLSHIKHGLDSFSYEGLAIMHRQVCLIAGSIQDKEGAYVLGENWSSCSRSDRLVDFALLKFTENVIPERTFRFLARNEPWRTMWASRKVDGLFNVPSIQMTDEQRTLVLWSQFYDNIYESPDCPSDSVLEDDDAIDGWVIVQRKKREKDQLSLTIEGKMSDKIKNADEIYVVAENAEQAKKIESLNTISAQIVKKQRLNKVKKEGVVKEVEFGDVQMKLKQELLKMQKERMNG